VSTCSDSLAALKIIRTVRTTSLLVHHCKKALNEVPIRNAVGVFCVSGHAGLRGNEIAHVLARGGTALTFLGPEPAVGVSRRHLQKRLDRWLVKQHGAQWRVVGDTQSQVQLFISGPSPDKRAKFLTFNRNKSRVVTGLLRVITPRGVIFAYWGCLTAPCIGSVGWERKHLFVIARL